MLINLKMLRVTVNAICVLAVVCLLAAIGFSAVDVDTTFNAAPDKNGANTGSVTVQPDGKIILAGYFSSASGFAAVNGVARVNQDGSFDTSFSCPVCYAYAPFILQPDGKIIHSNARTVYRLNSNGSVDNAFASALTGDGFSTVVTAYASQADGKVYASKIFRSDMNTSTGALYRLNVDGTVDSSFTPLSYNPFNNSQFVRKVMALPDGKVLIAGELPFGRFFKLNSDGTRDNSYDSPLVTPANSFNQPVVIDFAVQSTGKVLLAGRFTAVNGIARAGLTRLNTDGSVDTQFTSTAGGNPIYNQIRVLPEDKFFALVGLSLVRLNADGTRDTTFTGFFRILIDSFGVDAVGRPIVSGYDTGDGTTSVYGFYRLTTEGSRDVSFNAPVGMGGNVTGITVQTDGRILVIGDFIRMNGLPRRGFARINSDGTNDAGFNIGTGFTSSPRTVALQNDGKILVGGSFTSFNGTTQQSIVRLNSDGSLDASFNPLLPDSSIINSIAVQPDGKILIGGSFSSVNSVNRQNAARLNPNGTLDESFNLTIGIVSKVKVQPDGKIIVSGDFNGVNGFSRSKIARLNADGSLDIAFNAGAIGTVSQVEIQPDGKYLVLRLANNYTGLVRLNNDGTADNSFQSQTFATADSGFGIAAILPLNDGSVIIGGNFTSINGITRNNLALLKPDGSLDQTFNVVSLNDTLSSATPATVSVITRQPDGKILIGGNFIRVNNIDRLSIARLIVTQIASRSVPFDFDGDRKSDVSVFRPSNGVWYRINSQNGGVTQAQFGQSGDIIAPADYDGDGKTDLAVWRTNGASQASFYILQSATGTARRELFGETGDFPVSGDWDGDGKADVAVFRSNAVGSQSYFYYRGTSNNPNGNVTFLQWGTTGDKPLIGDFDGDGKRDTAVYRPSNGNWYVSYSSNNQFFSYQFGLSDDVPVPADFDGDGKTDLAVFRPSSGTWYRTNLLNNAFSSMQFGQSGDVPVAGDYDGDSKADIAVWRPATGVWYQQRSNAGFAAVQFGQAEDKPAEGAYNR